MPKYLNESAVFVTLEATRVNPGEIYETLSFLENLPAGVSQVDENPFYNPILLDQAVTSTTTISVPAGEKNIKLVLYASSGDWTVKFNSANATPVMTLLEGMIDNKKFLNRGLNSIVLTGTGKIQVRMEKA